MSKEQNDADEAQRRDVRCRHSYWRCSYTPKDLQELLDKAFEEITAAAEEADTEACNANARVNSSEPHNIEILGLNHEIRIPGLIDDYVWTLMRVEIAKHILRETLKEAESIAQEILVSARSLRNPSPTITPQRRTREENPPKLSLWRPGGLPT